jgi:transcriptional regulator with AAA-type ATPase domain
MSGKRRFALEDLPRRVGEPPDAIVSAAPAKHEPARRSRRQLWLAGCAEELRRLKESLEHCHGNVTEAARVSGIPRYRARRLLAADATRGKN